MLHHLVIFGATGDLTARYLMPALARLIETGTLPTPFRILGLSTEAWDGPQFRRHVAAQLEKHSEAHEEARERLVACLDYRSLDVTDRHAVATAVKPIEKPAVAYLALPSALFAPAIEALSRALPAGSRVVIEKPFGESLESAQALNRLLHEVFPEDAVFRMDHFLGMQPVQNLLGLRFANRLFEPLWNHQHVERVEVIWDETLALEGRASYYDRAGALRDMIQNHLLQLLCLVAMEPPLSLGAQDLRDRKVDLLRAVERLAPDDVERRTVRGRYAAGRIGERAIPAYGDEPGIDPGRHTETYAQAVLHIHNWRWAGVPFLLRTGKALARDRQEILVHFKPVPHLAFGKEAPAHPNRLRIPLSREGLALHLNVNGTEAPCELRPAMLETDLPPQRIPAYGRLLLDVLHGDHARSVRDDEAEESWRIVEPILAAWEEGKSPLREYPAGSAGPFSPRPLTEPIGRRDKLSAA